MSSKFTAGSQIANAKAVNSAVAQKGARASLNEGNWAAPSAQGKALLIADDIGIFLSVARSLGRAGIEVDVAICAEDYPGLASRYIEQVRCLPSYLATPQAWVEAAERLIESGGYQLVYPCSDSGLGMLNAVGAKIDPAKLVVPNPTAFSTFIDKAKTRQLAGLVGVPIAGGRALCAGPEALDIVAQGSLPVVVKPSLPYQFGSDEGKVKARIVRSKDDLAKAMTKFRDCPIVVEEVFEGDGIGVSVLAKAGVIKAVWQHRRIACADETGRSSKRIGEGVDKGLLADVTKLVEASDLTGVAMFEFIQNPATRKHILLEVNPRYWGSLALAVAAGADFPFWHWQMMIGPESEGKQATDEPCVKSASDPCVTKTNLDAECDRLSDYKQLGYGAFDTAWQVGGMLCAACLHPVKFDGWAKDDPAPHWHEVRGIFARLGTAFYRRLRPG